MRRPALVVGLAVLTGLVTGASLAEEPRAEPPLMAPPPHVDLTGHWTLDPKLSDGGEDEGREALKSQQGDRRRRRPPVFPGPDPSPGDGDDRLVPTGPGIDVTTPGMTGAPVAGDPFRQGGGSSGSSRSPHGAASEHVKDLPETLTIAQRPDLILIQENDDEARTRALRPDGTRQRSTNGKWEHRTRWDKGLLRVDTWHEDGVHAEEVFELAPDGVLLTVTVNVDDGDATLSRVRVFRPDKADES